MSPEDYCIKISNDWLWRESELRGVDARMLRNRDVLTLKMGILIAYSHWEGHFKLSANELLNFITEGISRKWFNWTDVKIESRQRLLLCKYRLTNIPSQSPETFLTYLNSLHIQRHSDILGARNEIIMVDDNLNCGRAEAVCRNLGIDYKWCTLKRLVIDERIVAYRNAIAHGSKRLRSGDEIDFTSPDIPSAIQEARALIRETKNRFENAINLREFLDIGNK